MRILQINIFFDQGSTGKIVGAIHRHLMDCGDESFVIYGRGTKVSDPSAHVIKMTSNRMSDLYWRAGQVLGLFHDCAWIETRRVLRTIRRIKPDLVHIHCLNCFYINPAMLLKEIGKMDIPVLTTHHADILISGNCVHSYECEKWKTGCRGCKHINTEIRTVLPAAVGHNWRVMRNGFRRVRQLYANGVSHWMSNRVRQSPFFADSEVSTIFNGVETKTFHYREEEARELRNKLCQKGEKIVLHVTPDLGNALKGGQYIPEIARSMPDVRFVIVGAYAAPFEFPPNVSLVPHTENAAELAAYYSAADVTLLLSRRESFSMVTAESLCCGTPVVGFEAGAPETIALPEFSEFVAQGDTSAVASALRKRLSALADKRAISAAACDRYEVSRMTAAYRALYSRIIKGGS